MSLMEWQEPDLATPMHGVTGLPMAEGPPIKNAKKRKSALTGESNFESQMDPEVSTIKQESQVSSSPSSSCLRHSSEETMSSPAEGPSRPVTPPQEQKLKIRLKTELFDKIATTSESRRSSRVAGRHFDYYAKAREDLGLTSRKGSAPATSSPDSRPSTPPPQNGPMKREQESPGSEPSRKIRKIKVIQSPHKAKENPFGYAAVKKDEDPQPRQAALASALPASNEIVNNDFCSTCGGTGKFLCCETCPRSFHFTCVDPPLDEDSLPDGEWHCRECYTRRRPPLPYERGLFSKLFNQLERRNPRQFQLPKYIKERFEGVSANELGEYDDSVKPPAKSKQGKDVVDDPLRLLDKNGNPMTCFRCSRSALGTSPMLTCDVCSSNWHVDCVTDPVWSAGTRWKCPNHVDQAVKLPRRPRKSKVTDTSLRRGFQNTGDIEVLDSSDEEEELVQHIPFFDVYDTPTGVAAKVTKNVEKTFESEGIIYRLPARGIKLDFIEAVHKDNEEPYPDSVQSQILVALDELATRPPEMRNAVRDLCYLQADGSIGASVATVRANLSILIDAALGEPHSTPQPMSPTSPGTPPPQTGSLSNGAVEDDQDLDYQQLVAIKKLLQLKGKERLMKYLLEN